MPNEEHLIQFGDGRRTESEERELQRKGGINSGRARVAKAVFNRLLQQSPEDVLSGAALDEIRKMGVDPHGKTFMELGAVTTLLQWALGDMRAGKLAMEISGNDSAAEQQKIEREKLKAIRQHKNGGDGSGIVADIIEAVKHIE